MFVRFCRMKNKFVDLTKPFKNPLKIFKVSKKRIHTVPKEGPWSVLFFGVDDFSLESLKGLHEE